MVVDSRWASSGSETDVRDKAGQWSTLAKSDSRNCRTCSPGEHAQNAICPFPQETFQLWGHLSFNLYIFLHLVYLHTTD